MAVIVTPPAGQGVVRLEGAGMKSARADLLEAPGRRGGLAHTLLPQQARVLSALMAQVCRRCPC